MGDLIGKAKDLTGQKFYHLTAIKKAGYKESMENGKVRRRTTWWCECDCGNPELLEFVGTDLVRGRKKSCGCVDYQLINVRKANSKRNEYNLLGEYGIGYTYNTDEYGRNEFYFDLEDYNKIKDYCWRFNKAGYVVTTININKEKHDALQLHNIIFEKQDNKIPDHIHGKKSRNDNRKSNLRYATQSQNGMNHGLNSNNTSGVAGVQWHSRDQIWEAWITINRNHIYLGRSTDFDQAVQLRKNAEEKYYGEWSYDNSQNYHIENDYDVKRDEPAC